MDLERLRHTTSHVMAQAVQELFPGAKLAIGPPIEEGFYYDFDLPRPLTEEDLTQIEARMRRIIAQDMPLVRQAISKQEAQQLFAEQPYKLELIAAMPEGEAITVYTQDGFTDLCRGPHLERTGHINPRAFKLLSVAGAYWRGDERRPMLQRIYGTAFPTPEELADYLEWLRQVGERDHRRLGRELDLFSIHPESGPGLILWHPKGARIRTIVEDYWRDEHYRAGYELVYTPHIGRAELWRASGHLDFFQEGMYSPMDIDGQDYYLKPMNCPFHMLIYKSRTRSYRELPLRWAELGTVYRYERSGVLHGLMRTRGFTQDDAHIICTPEQVEEEILGVLRFSLRMWHTLGIEDIAVYLSTRPEKAIGEPERWEQATEALRRAIEAESLEYQVNEGEGAFYGPKIDLNMRDALGREWQTATIQFDFNLPERFDMTYVGADGREHRPYMVHRTLLGTDVRWFGILLEHYAGAFPVWLSPVQVAIIPIADRHLLYAQKVKARLEQEGLRVELDERSERMQAKIRDAQLEKIPYMLILGDREVEGETVSVRLRTEEDLGPHPLEEFVSVASQVAKEKRLDLGFL